MTRPTSQLRCCPPTYLALCLAIAIAGPAVAADASSIASGNATNVSSTANGANPQSAQTLAGVEVTAAAAVQNIAPTQGSMIAVQPQSIIGSTYLQENVSPTGDYTDAMAISPSVYAIAPNGSGLMEAQAASIRGFQDGQYNVTFDGIPWGDSNDFTHHSTSYYTNRMTDSVVVDRGPGTASTLGNATFGGTVSVQSVDPRNDFGIEPFLSIGSWQTWVEGARLDTGKIAQTGGTTALLEVQNSSSDGYLTYAGQRRQNVFAKIVQPLGDDTTLTFAGMYNKIHQYVPVGETKAQIAEYGPNYGLNDDPASQAYYRYNADDINTYMGYVGLNSQFDGWTLDNKAYTYAYNHFGFNGEDPNGETPNGTYYGPDDVPGQHMRNWYRSWGDIFRLSKDLGPGQLRTGFWYDDQDNLRWQYEFDDTLNFYNAASVADATDRFMTDTLRTFQPFVEYQWNIADNAWLVGGVKYNDFKRHIDAEINQKTGKPLDYGKNWDATLPSLALHWQFNPNWTAYAQWAKGFLAPNLNTFYTTQPQLSNSLLPEQTINTQLGTTWSDDRLTVSADVYHIDFTNQILSRKVAGVTYFYNSGGVTYRGFETEATWMLGDGFSVYGNGSLNRAIDNQSNTWVPDTPHKTAALGLIYRDGPMYASLIDRFVGRTYGDSGDTQPIGAYAVTNLALSYSFGQVSSDLKNLKVAMQVNNLLDNRNINFLAGYTGADGTPLYYTIPARNYNVTVSADF